MDVSKDPQKSGKEILTFGLATLQKFVHLSTELSGIWGEGRGRGNSSRMGKTVFETFSFFWELD